MGDSPTMLHGRRRFLRYLAASPLLATPALFGRGFRAVATTELGRMLEAGNDTGQGGGLITSADQALDVMEFEAVAQKVLPPAHFAYLATGVDDDATVKANHDGFSRFEIRSRRLVNVANLDTSVRLFGTTWETPIFLSPLSAMKAFHEEGEVGVAKAARSKRHLQIVSTIASATIEEVTAARGAPVWQQLYPTNNWKVAQAIIQRAEAVRSPALVFTVDLQSSSNREAVERARRVDDRKCSTCHENGLSGFAQWKSMFHGIDVSRATGLFATNLTWDFVKRLKDATAMKLLIKGIVTGEDAQIAVEHGVDGIVVSNHGGRSEETLRPTIDCLPEVVDAVKGKIPVLIDGGVRRGTDIFKALAFGATGVGIGRPQAWGLAAFGEAGVEAVLTILRRELEAIMRQAGTPSIGGITRNFVVRA